MRRLILLGLALALACSSGENTVVNPPPPPPPPSPPGPPATVTIVSGDGQSALPGSMLPARLSVLVKDAAGTALSGITVQFSVDSGGGSLSQSSATTGIDGVAVGGDWVLGAAAGTQVVSAKVGVLTAVKFHAQALGPAAQSLFTNATVGTGGGALVYTKAGDALSGFTITVPAGAYPSSAQFTVVADPAATVPLPADFTQVGPTLVITNSLGFADSAMTLTMPMQLASDVGVAPFYYDPASGKFEGIPLVDRTATGATLVTHHFSRDLMAIPGNAAIRNSMRASLRLGFGAVTIVWVKTPMNKLVGTYNTGFLAGVDNWEFVNYGDYISPHGDCEGMSLTEMFYYFFHRQAGEPALYHHFDLTLSNVLDNVQGIRFAGSAQLDMQVRYDRGLDQVKQLTAQGVARGAKVVDLTSTWILLTIKLTGNPVLLGIYGSNAAHAVVAYAASSNGSHTDVRFADPNFPASGRTMSFESGVLTPVTMSRTAGAPEDAYTSAYALAVSGEIPIITLSNRFDEFMQQKAGADRYPAQYRVEYYDNLSDTWQVLSSPLFTTDANLAIRHICVSCPSKSTGGAPDEQLIEIWDAAGANRLRGDGNWTNTAGSTQYYARLSAYTVTDPSKDGFVDAMPFTVISQPFTVTADKPSYQVGDVITLTAVAGSLASIGSTYTLAADDGSPAVTQLSGTFGFSPKQFGPLVLTVTLKNALGTAIARSRMRLMIRADVAISPSPINVAPGGTIALTAVVQGGVPAALAPSLIYEWAVNGPGAGDIFLTNTPGPTLTHTFGVAGAYTVRVIVTKGAEDTALAIIQNVPVQVKNWPGAWRLTTFTLTNAAPRTGFLPVDGPPWDAQEALLARVVQTPSDGMIFLEDNALFNEHAVYFQIAPPGQGKDAIYYVFGSYYTLLARAAPIQFSHYNSTGTLTTGAIDGVGYTSNVMGNLGYTVELNSITAQKNGDIMTGTMTVSPYSIGGGRTYSFVATLVTPQ